MKNLVVLEHMSLPRPDLHVWGSGHLMQTLMKHDLVDVFWLHL